MVTVSPTRLDRALASGVNPAAGVLLAARAARLTSPRCRSELADALERITSDRRHGRFAVLPDRRAVDLNRARITALAQRLRDPAPVYARGVAMLRLLLRDGGGPVYWGARGEALERALRDTSDALAGR